MIVALALAVLAGWGCQDQESGPPPSSSQPTGAQPTLKKVSITVGQAPLEVEVADTFESRRRGYMFRERPAEGGMLFVWPREKMLSFWMENTRFDIDVGYIATDGKLFEIERMKAYRLDSVPSSQPALYALEVPAGWFAEHAVAVGATVKIPPEVKSAEDDSVRKGHGY
jgi:hypothetical protein